MVDRDAMRATELGEAEFMFQMFARADERSRSALGMTQRRIGAGEVTVMAFQIAPEADGDWESLLQEREVTPGSAWVKFAGAASPRADVPTDLCVDLLGPQHGAEFAQVMCTGFTTYGAWDGDDLVATATLFVRGDIGTLSGAWITCETGAETPENPNPSLHNMRRIGLTELYERRNWVWRA